MLPLSIAAGICVFLFAVRGHYPIGQWLFWVYAKLWLWCALFMLGCVSVGNLVIGLLLPQSLPLRERMLYSLCAGVVVFFQLMFLGGLLGLYGPVFAVAMPVLLVLVGAPRLFLRARRALRHLRAARQKPRPPPSWWTTPVLLFGSLGVLVVYFSILAPQNIAFDAHFYHLGLAQQYVTDGVIRRFPEGWAPGALPQLASVLYTWTFLLPGLDMFGRICAAAHLEFTLFLSTLAGVPILVRWLAPGTAARGSWAAFFLFPGVLLYDSSLTVAADHIAALWTIPVYLALRRAWSDLNPRRCALLAVMLVGPLLTKYQATYVLAFPALVIAIRLVWLLGAPILARLRRQARLPSTRSPLAGVATLVLVGTVLTMPHWLKNWVWYGDPLYPYLHRFFAPTRWAPDMGSTFTLFQAWQSDGWGVQATTPGGRLLETLRVLVTFSMEPHDWPRFHGTLPVFGSLFTLSLLALPFLRGARRVWGVVIACELGLLVWYWTLHQDRYLQILVPWMVCAVVAAVTLAWRTNTVNRVLVAGLLAIHIVWAGDIIFIPAHAMTAASPIVTTSKLLATGYQKKYAERFVMDGALFDIGRSPNLPPNARVLLHENNPRLGIWRPVVMDVSGWQYALRYELLDSPSAVHEALHRLGVTFVVSRPSTSRNTDSLGSDLRYFDFLRLGTTKVSTHGELGLFKIADSPPQGEPNNRVAYLGCDKFYEPGLHSLRTMTVHEKWEKKPRRRPAQKRLTKEAASINEIVSQADYAVTDNACKRDIAPDLLTAFVQIATRDNETLWARTQPLPR